MNELDRSRMVWESAQAEVVSTSAALLRASTLDEAELATEEYEDAVEYCSMAKEHYDIVRAESFVESPVADDITGANFRCVVVARAG